MESLPKEYGDWHVIYVRVNRWAKKGVLQVAFLQLQQQGIIQITVNVVSLDSTCSKYILMEYDKELYKQRNQVERLFRRLKRFRRIFTRYDKLNIIFFSFVYFALMVAALM